MSKRALVLGGGGTVGVAWETGLAAGLLENGINLGEADVIIGTSAGSVVGAQLAAGYDPRIILELHKSMLAAAPGAAAQGRPQVDMEVSQQVWSRWASAGEMSPAVRRELGALALAARTIDETSYVAMLAQATGVQEWPERRLLITAVAADTGDFVVWEKGGEASIEQAVASSCCVPGIFPPVTVGAHRYVDGGVRSGTNADLAEGHGVVVVVAPLGDRQFEHGRAAMMNELASLQAGGSKVELIVPDTASIEAFGLDMMDASRVVPAAEAGFRQGAALAAQLWAIWE